MLYGILIIAIIWIPCIYAIKATPKDIRQMQDEWKASEERRKQYEAALRQYDLSELTAGQRKKIYRELRQKYDLEIIRHTTKPLMADIAKDILPFIKGMLITLPVCSLLLFFILEADCYGFGNALKMCTELFREAIYMYDIPIALILDFYFLMVYGCDFLHKYMKISKCHYHDTCVTVRRYLCPNKYIDYKEIAECIKTQKIVVKNGRFELPCLNGQIPVYCAGKTPSPEFYQFINQKCGIKMPTMNFHKQVRLTGIGYILMCMGIVIFLLLTYIMLLSAFWKYKLDFNGILTYISTYYYQFMIPGLFCIGLGLIFKVLFFFPARKHFKQYEHIIRVKLW